MKVRQVGTLVKEAFSDFFDDQAMRISAAIAFYTMFSIAPLLVIAVGVAGLVFGEESARQQVMTQVESNVGGGASSMLTEAMNRTKPGASIWAIVIGGGLMLLGASGVFGQLQQAMNDIWDVTAKGGIKNTILKRLFAFLMVFSVGLVLLGLLVLSAVIAGIESVASGLLPIGTWFWQLLAELVSVAVLIFLFAAIYKWVPDAQIRWKDVWVGAIVTAILFVIGKFAIGFYLGRSSMTSTFGAAGSLVALLAWVYYSAMIFFLGAEITQVYARMKGREIRPSDKAQWKGREAA